ncbi:MAG: endolytic transglycosylase MltG [Chitinophagaceae bacterium]|nr:endolytic transglycosylase MltG [Chitinophagaceae bacterium]
MKKKVIYSLLVVILLSGGFLGWQIFGPTVSAPGGKYFFIPTGSSYASVREQLIEKKIIRGPFFFDLLAKQFKYTKNVKPGRYPVREGMSLYKLIRMLRSGSQSPVNLTITKLRTKEDLAQKLAANFETDSLSVINFLNNADSLRPYQLDTHNLMTAVIPNTYAILWNTPVSRIFKRLYNEKEKFWTEERKRKAAALNMTPEQVYAMASIVEEETLKEEDKGKIASVYINRIASGQKLEADPTIKFALRNFGLKRIRNSHKEAAAASPYNTYYVKGLPPGPICTPSSNTIDAVLNAPSTDYIFFVARPDWSGLSNFTSSYAEHQINAKNYQHFLDSINIR